MTTFFHAIYAYIALHAHAFQWLAVVIVTALSAPGTDGAPTSWLYVLFFRVSHVVVGAIRPSGVINSFPPTNGPVQKYDTLQQAIDKARKAAPVLIFFALLASGCTTLEGTARDLAAASQGFIVTAQQKHTQMCSVAPAMPVCVTINKAIGAQNVLIDAVETYCGWPARPTPAQLTQAGALPCKRVAGATAALQAATNNLDALMSDLKGAAQ